MMKTRTTTTIMKRPIKWSEFSLSADTLVRISKKIHFNDDEQCQNQYCSNKQQQQQQKCQDETTWLKKFIISNKMMMKMNSNTIDDCQLSSVSYMSNCRKILSLYYFFF